MKELDFDELDRAVSSLMGGVSATAPTAAPTAPAEKVLTITPSTNDAALPAMPVTEPLLAPASPTAPIVSSPASSSSPSPMIAKRTGGRFMDMVQPSAGSKPVTRPVVSRQGATIISSLRPVEAEPVVAKQVVSVEPDMPTPSTSSSSDWPDPIDMSMNEVDAEPTPAESVEVHHLPDTDISPAEEAATNEAIETAPLQTPFLSDTKVDKRPLGAFNDESANEGIEADNTAATISTEMTPEEAATDVQLVPDPSDVPVELPAELQDDVMAIEADSPRVAPQPEVSPQTPAAPVEPTTSSIAHEVASSTPVMGVTSIAQQYHTEPSTEDATHAGIYDAEAYHQPLQHPVQKKSGWLWVLWIVLLLGLGAGGAAILYYLGII